MNDEEEIPEWEVEEEKIPPSLREKWRRDEKKGLGAGPCRGCGTLLTEDALSCPVCERLVANDTGSPTGGLFSLLRACWPISTFIIIFCIIVFFLTH